MPLFEQSVDMESVAELIGGIGFAVMLAEFVNLVRARRNVQAFLIRLLRWSSWSAAAGLALYQTSAQGMGGTMLVIGNVLAIGGMVAAYLLLVKGVGK